MSDPFTELRGNARENENLIEMLRGPSGADPHAVTRAFEAEVARYTGAKHCVAVNSCTMAILLAVRWYVRKLNDDLPFHELKPVVNVPRRTYVGVPMSVLHAGARIVWTNPQWDGAYQLYPSPVWDSARWLTTDLYKHLDGRTKGTADKALVCLSFHATKTLGIEQGGAILTDDAEAAAWLRRMRFDGRTEGVAVADDSITELGYHCYLNPSTAAQGLMRLRGLPRHNLPMPWDDYPDLSTCEAFRNA